MSEAKFETQTLQALYSISRLPEHLYVFLWSHQRGVLIQRSKKTHKWETARVPWSLWETYAPLCTEN